MVSHGKSRLPAGAERPEHDLVVLSTHRHGRVGNVRKASHEILDVLFYAAEDLIQLRRSSRDLAQSPEEIVGALPRLLPSGDLLRSAVLLGLQLLDLADQFPPRVVELEDRSEVDGWVARLEPRLHVRWVFPQLSNVEHRQALRLALRF
jgi:hypothetical protein